MVEGPILLLIIAASICLIIIGCVFWKLHPAICLLSVALVAGIAAGIEPDSLLSTISGGFGNMVGSIGLLVLCGAILSVFLERTGAAQAIARSLLRVTRGRFPELVMAIAGGLTGIPVFCDSGFLLLHPAAKRLAILNGKHPKSLCLATAGGLYATHVMVPPTPGPLAVAGNLGLASHLGLVMAAGLTLAIPAILAGTYWAVRNSAKQEWNENQAHFSSPEEEKKLPSTMISLIPMLLPILLIALGSVFSEAWKGQPHLSILSLCTRPVPALAIGCLSAWLLLNRFTHRQSGQWVEEGIRQAGPIILITAAGGAFGAVISRMRLDALIQTFIPAGPGAGLWLLVIVFMLAAILKSAQGSSTAAMIITSALIAPLLPALNMNAITDSIQIAMAIGAGAMMVSHANDSYFWVVANFSGMELKDGLKGFTLLTLFQGITIFICLLLFRLFFT